MNRAHTPNGRSYAMRPRGRNRASPRPAWSRPHRARTTPADDEGRRRAAATALVTGATRQVGAIRPCGVGDAAGRARHRRARGSPPPAQPGAGDDPVAARVSAASPPRRAPRSRSLALGDGSRVAAAATGADGVGVGSARPGPGRSGGVERSRASGVDGVGTGVDGVGAGVDAVGAGVDGGVGTCGVEADGVGHGVVGAGVVGTAASGRGVGRLGRVDAEGLGVGTPVAHAGTFTMSVRVPVLGREDRSPPDGSRPGTSGPACR